MSLPFLWCKIFCAVLANIIGAESRICETPSAAFSIGAISVCHEPKKPDPVSSACVWLSRNLISHASMGLHKLSISVLVGQRGPFSCRGSRDMPGFSRAPFVWENLDRPMGKVCLWTRRRIDHDHQHHDAHHDLHHVTRRDQDAHHATNTDCLIRHCRKQEDKKRYFKTWVSLAATSITEDNCKT